MCHNYSSLPVVIAKGKGMDVWDVEGKHYLDFHSGYSAVNQGHVHPKILEKFIEQASTLTHCSRAFYSNTSGEYAQFMSETFGFDKVLPMNTGCEAGETAVKLARRWGYTVKGVEENKAEVIMANGCFWGWSITASGACDDPVRSKNFGPFTPGFPLVDFNNVTQIEQAFKANKNICAIMLEPIQGENGIIVPEHTYLNQVRALCDKYNVLLILDEIQTGLGRCGAFQSYDHQKIKPDILAIGKSLSGGFLPASAVLCNDNIMMEIKPGEHGSTFGGNALACGIVPTAVKVLFEEGMIENSRIMGDYIQTSLKQLSHKDIKEVRGQGLFIALEMKSEALGKKLAKELVKKGILTKDTHGHSLWISPPLIITKEQANIGLDKIQATLKEFF
jgi:ornithine--oxo-acid transaminase